MKDTTKKPRRTESGDIRAEYAFDYSRAKPNRFALRRGGNVVAVVLDPDVAAVFGSSTKVNALLRSVIAALPTEKAVSPVRAHRRKAG